MGLFSRSNRNQDADNAALSGARTKLTSDDVDQVRFLITSRLMVNATKLVMDRTGLDLKKSKQIVDEIRYGTYVPPIKKTPLMRRPGTNLAERTRALKAAGELHQATALVVSETGMTEVEAGLFVGALKPQEDY
ncbi:hypothetical protein E1263_25625 [Kribbella antibiotica]|uniref:Uncharacterized protein n=1 Tax=Kribbella antibiotica TaxID=190195 RepID=A0A4R4ZHV7_9ACTN|nr:hypothetical protein [Kribbella antibiotica]TDD56192.1 hypothetical protein E1263_25625 [Kribbella antibiotica]